MPIINLHKDHPLEDGRQSKEALLLRQGVQRFFVTVGLVCMCELPLPNGRRADVVVVTRKGDIYIIEIKTSAADLHADHKWPDYRDFCDRLYFASHASVPMELFPEDCGFILADQFGAEILRNAPEQRMTAAARKAMTLRIARCASARLTRAEMDGLVVQAEDTDF